MCSTLTEYLMNIKGDLTKLKEIRGYLDSNSDSQFSMNWQTIEAFNAILTNCSLSEVTDDEALSGLLDSFSCLVTNSNDDDEVWANFEFEIGILCMKILSAIEQSSMFGVLFYKFLFVVNTICDKHSELWKGVARQILNIFINKNFSFEHLEINLQIYMTILKKIKSSTLYNFAQQNLHLLHTFSLKIEHLGDFEIQCNIMEVIFLHFLHDKNLIKNFFVKNNAQLKNIFEKLDFNKFEDSTRICVNSLNKSLGIQRGVFSINCKRIYVGNRDLCPVVHDRLIQLNANDFSRRLSTEFINFSLESSSFRTINIQFSDLEGVEIERQPENRFHLIIKSNNLNKIDSSIRAGEIVCLVAEDDNPGGEILKFKNYLEKSIGKGKAKKKCNEQFEKLSQTSSVISIDRSIEGKEKLKIVPWNKGENESVYKGNLGLYRIIPRALDLVTDLEHNKPLVGTKLNGCLETAVGEKNKIGNNVTDECADSKYFGGNDREMDPLQQMSAPETKTPEHAAKNSLGSQELTPNSFVESLNKNLGLNSPDIVQSFEETLDPSPFEKNDSGTMNHRLFQNSYTFFNVLKEDSRKREKSSIEYPKSDKENEMNSNNQNKPKFKKTSAAYATTQNDRNDEIDISDPQADLFTFNEKKKKPSFPRIPESKKKAKNLYEKRKKKIDGVNSMMAAPEQNNDLIERPSLLDPNGYAYQRWLRPTTSERSNFWLNKLNASNNKRANESNVYDFADDSESQPKNNNKKKRGRKKLEKSENKNEKMRNSKKNSVSLEQFKKLTTTGKGKYKIPQVKQKKFEMEQHLNKTAEFEEFEKNLSPGNKSATAWHDDKSIPAFFENFNNRYDNLIAGKSSSCESVFENISQLETDCVLHVDRQKNNQMKLGTDKINSDELKSDCTTTVPISSKKREHSEDENSLSKIVVKKKNPFGSYRFQVRLQKIEEKYRLETDQIIEVVKEANENILNRIYRLKATDIISYLKQAEAVEKSMACDDELKTKKERLKKLIFYFRMGCCMTEFSRTMENSCEKLRQAFDNLSIGKLGNCSEKINSFNENLKSLIGKEVNRYIRGETAKHRNRLLQFAAMLNMKFNAV